jgi:hypothetical protein
MADPKFPETVSNADLVKAIHALAEAQRTKSPLEHSGLSPEQQRRLTDTPAVPRYRYVPCKSEETGATFDAHVLESRKYPNGRIVALRGYTHPAGVEISQLQGGLVPEGMAVFNPDARSYTVQYKQWRWETFYQVDLRRYCSGSRELTPGLCAEPKGMSTPWLAGAVRQVGVEDDAA